MRLVAVIPEHFAVEDSAEAIEDSIVVKTSRPIVALTPMSALLP